MKIEYNLYLINDYLYFIEFLPYKINFSIFRYLKTVNKKFRYFKTFKKVSITWTNIKNM